MDTLPKIKNSYKTGNGCFFPGSLSIRYNFPFSDLKHLPPDEAGLKYGHIILHENCHYQSFLGTTWGIVNLRYIKSWVQLGISALLKVKSIFDNQNVKIPFPLQNFVEINLNDKFVQAIKEEFRDFSLYSKALYFDFGFLVHDNFSSI